MSSLRLDRLASLACLLEVSAPKVGNVHRGADFEDLCLNDFLISATIIGDTLQHLEHRTTGELILKTIQQTQLLVGTNTNLGISLLLVPLTQAATLARFEQTRLNETHIQTVLSKLTSKDGQQVFEAIRTANPGGLQSSDQWDVEQTNQPVDLLAAMKLASPRDLVARQYANQFADVRELVAPLILEGHRRTGRLDWGIVYAQLGVLARHPDSLIARKCGLQLAQEASDRAGQIFEPVSQISSPWSERQLEDFFDLVAELDFWLRSDGHRRNPGTTADLIAAGLFVTLVNEELNPPFASAPA